MASQWSPAASMGLRLHHPITCPPTPLNQTCKYVCTYSCVLLESSRTWKMCFYIAQQSPVCFVKLCGTRKGFIVRLSLYQDSMDVGLKNEKSDPSGVCM